MTDNAAERIWAIADKDARGGRQPCGLWRETEILQDSTDAIFHHKPVEYVRADLYAAVCAERDALKEQGEREGASAVDLMIRHMNRWKAAEAEVARLRAQINDDYGKRARAALQEKEKALDPAPDARTYEDGLEDAAKVAEHAHLKRVEGTVGGVIVQTRVYIAAAIRAMKGNSDE
jgi:hypothetical protein